MQITLRHIFLASFLFSGLLAYSQRVGIGTNDPSEMLDINGRMRLQQSNGQTSGVYFNSTNLSNRSFAGIMNADNMGFWGTGTSWHFVMNMTTGNVGIGTTSPTERLDLNGTLRIRKNAKAGAVLTGLNTQGNMEWVGPVYFLTMGTPSGADFNVPTSGYVNFSRVPFATPDINHGNAWDANNQVFIAPLNGIYHFGAHIQVNNSKANLIVQLIRRRNNVNTTLYFTELFGTYDGKMLDVDRPLEICLDTKMEINDVIWLEVSNVLSGNNCTLAGDRGHHYFSGQLIALQ